MTIEEITATALSKYALKKSREANKLFAATGNCNSQTERDARIACALDWGFWKATGVCAH